MKCLSKSPKVRYESAALLADDRWRFLEDKTIRARRPSPLQLFWRWYKKHACLMLVAFFIVSPLTWIFYIIGGVFKQTTSVGLTLDSPKLIVWPMVWMILGYFTITKGLVMEIANVVMLVGFLLLPLFFRQDPQGVMIVGLIGFFGMLLQIGSFLIRFQRRRREIRKSMFLSP